MKQRFPASTVVKHRAWRVAWKVTTASLIGLALWATGAPAQNYLWSQRFGSTGTDTGTDVAVDGSGNVLLTGDFSGIVDFGGGDRASAGAADIFIVKYNAAGVYQWSLQLGSTGGDYGRSLAVDGSDNVLVTGYFQETVNFGGADLVSVGSNDIFLAKYDAAGVHQWSTRFGGTGSDYGRSLAVDGSGNVLVAGYFQDTVNFGGADLVSAGSYDIVLAKYNAAGVHQWSTRFGGTGSDYGRSVSVDGSGNVLLAGDFASSADFGGGPLVSAGGNDIFVAKYNSAGAHQWSARFGSTGDDNGRCVAGDGPGNVTVTGHFRGIVDFGGGNLVSVNLTDIFVAKFNAAGVHQWSMRFGGTGADNGESVGVDGAGNVLVAGNFETVVNFGDGTSLASSGAADVFLAKYDANGGHLWSKRFGDTGQDFSYAVAVDGSSRSLVTGSFSGTVDFGGGDLTSAGGADIFVAMYGRDLPEPLITSISDIPNDQGRRVKIRFMASGQDQAISATQVVHYEAHRRDDPGPAAVGEGSSSATGGRELLGAGWTEVGYIHAHAETEYAIDVPTIGDSTIALGQYYSVFKIRAATSAPATFFDSASDSGWSLDNLAPGIPANFAYAAGGLSWDESAAEDFDFFTVYGSNTDSFGSATVVDYSVAPAMDVTSSPYVFYFVTATDFSGNEGKSAKVNTLSGVGGTPKSYVLSVFNYPNPFNPGTTVSYTVPSRGTVTVVVYDARGAQIATLVRNREHAAGAYTIEWDGRTNAGAAVSSGVYFVRIDQNGSTRSKKITLLK